MPLEYTCPPHLERTFETLSRKWVGLILRVLMAGPRRFTGISGAVEGISDRVLSERLRDLEELSLVERHVYDRRPVLVEYKLTEKGLALKDVFQAMHDWGARWEAAEAHVPPGETRG